MADETIPLIPKAESFYVHTGSICSLAGLAQKINQAPDVEVSFYDT